MPMCEGLPAKRCNLLIRMELLEYWCKMDLAVVPAGEPVLAIWVRTDSFLFTETRGTVIYLMDS